MRSDPERLTDIVEAADKIRFRVARGREEFDAEGDLQIVCLGRHVGRDVGDDKDPALLTRARVQALSEGG